MSVRVRLVARASLVCFAGDGGVWTVPVCEEVVLRVLYVCWMG